MLLLLKEWKLALAGVFLLTSLGLAGWIRYQGAKIETLKGSLKAANVAAEEWRAASGQRDVVIEELRAGVEKQNAAVTEWQKRSEDLDSRVRELEPKLAKARADLRAHLASVNPLPGDCAEAVKEVARRIRGGE